MTGRSFEGKTKFGVEPAVGYRESVRLGIVLPTSGDINPL